MDDMRDRMIYVLMSKPYGQCSYEDFADYLLANGVILPDWISVEDRLPDDGVRVLVYLKAEANEYTRCDTDRRVNNKWVRWGEKYITHWMPLPEPPKEAEKALREKDE